MAGRNLLECADSNAEPPSGGSFSLVALRIPLLLSPTTLNQLMRFLARPKNLEKGLG